jgi:hypothetical protein
VEQPSSKLSILAEGVENVPHSLPTNAKILVQNWTIHFPSIPSPNNCHLFRRCHTYSHQWEIVLSVKDFQVIFI